MSSAGSRVNRRSNNENGRAISGSVGFGFRGQIRKCQCGQFLAMKTVTDMINLSYRKKFWGCRNWRNRFNSGCNYFQFLADDDNGDVIDERDMKIARLKKKNGKLKHEVCFLKEELCNSKSCSKIAIMFGFVCFRFNIVLMTMMLSMYLK